MEFRRSLFGYSRSAVDRFVADQEDARRRYAEQQVTHGQYVSEAAAARRALEAEVETLRAGAPMLNVRDELNSLLVSFAVEVSALREQAELDAVGTRMAADAYAEERRTEADRLFTETQDTAAALAEETLRLARQQVDDLVHGQVAVERALTLAAQGIVSWMAIFGRLRDEDSGTGSSAGTSDGSAPGQLGQIGWTPTQRGEAGTAISLGGDDDPGAASDAVQEPVDEDGSIWP
jgi:hypothetical protein